MADEKAAEKPDDNKTSVTANAALKIIERLPIDGLKPPIDQLGRLLETLFLFPNDWLERPRRKMLLRQLESQRFFERYAPKIRQIPEDQVRMPSAQTVSDALEGFVLSADEPSLQEMYLNLLASAMNSDTAAIARGAFAQTLKQMSADEAKIMHLFSETTSLAVIDVVELPNFSIESFSYSGKSVQELLKDAGDGIEKERPVVTNFSVIGERAECTAKNSIPFFIGNLVRLGLIEKRHLVTASNFALMNDEFLSLENHQKLYALLGETDDEVEATIHKHKLEFDNLCHLYGMKKENMASYTDLLPELKVAFYRRHLREERSLEFRKFVLTLSMYGRGFCQVCLPLEDRLADDPRLVPAWQPNTDTRHMAKRVAEIAAAEAERRYPPGISS